MSSHTYDNKPPEYFGQGRSEMLKFVPDSTRKLLEVGCGKGEFVAKLKATRALRTTGVEPYPDAAVEARKHFDVVLESGIDDAVTQLLGCQFDCIVFNDVLEHMVDPWAVLRAIKPLLTETGCVVASIPNMRYWPVLNDLFIHANWEYADTGVLDRTHLRFFTRSTISELFTSSGYRVERMEGINAIELPWKVALLNRLIGQRFDDTRFTQFACVARAA
jgi:2-polyprenyl-3-methyl-5-hydroxy-6-metoxy-1,4-benzoquinol methylase